MIRTFAFPYTALQIKATDLEKNIGYVPDSSMEAFAADYNDVLGKAGSTVEIQCGYRTFQPVTVNEKDISVQIASTVMYPGSIILQQLKGSTGVLVFACTAGEAITDESRRCTARGDTLKAYLYDVMGSVSVEKAADLLEIEAKKELNAVWMKITRRLSPGYCGWDVAEQNKLFGLLPDGFCGIRLTESSLMRPIKSVSGIIGFGKNVQRTSRPCRHCYDTSCVYNRRKNRGTKRPGRDKQSELQ